MENNTTASVSNVAFIIAFLIIVECAKEPEYICDYCDKVYKQEGRYRAHMMKCVDKDTQISASEFSVLLRQNNEMMVLLQKQQETIQLLVSQLVPVVKMNIE